MKNTITIFILSLLVLILTGCSGPVSLNSRAVKNAQNVLQHEYKVAGYNGKLAITDAYIASGGSRSFETEYHYTEKVKDRKVSINDGASFDINSNGRKLDSYSYDKEKPKFKDIANEYHNVSWQQSSGKKILKTTKKTFSQLSNPCTSKKLKVDVSGVIGPQPSYAFNLTSDKKQTLMEQVNFNKKKNKSEFGGWYYLPLINFMDMGIARVSIETKINSKETEDKISDTVDNSIKKELYKLDYSTLPNGIYDFYYNLSSSDNSAGGNTFYLQVINGKAKMLDAENDEI